MTQTEIIEYAIIGLTTKMNEVEKSVMKGERIIRDRINGLFSDKSLKTTEEIRNVIKIKRTELDELTSKRTELEWKLI